MTLSIEKCPKCNGQGKIRYRFWMSEIIVYNLILLKAKYPLHELDWSMYVISIKCPLCDGDGIFDWVKKAMKNNIDKNQRKISGNMDIYWQKAVNTWPLSNNTHTWFLCSDSNLYKNPINVINCSQKRYRGVKLNKNVLTMGVRQLEELHNKIINYYKSMNDMQNNLITRKIVIKELQLLELNDYLPDKFCYPNKDDYISYY
ncbi:hypothetical protein [uncultured Desulfosarcina sp.]|uniref:hypothetical protein n=1 Tax=uncultured Desulfosarcina sp. TaxID=218289 RepID=UPI0029C8F3A2|nr:hypothetical protein [uncultured Desulfosarcina sp.]